MGEVPGARPELNRFGHALRARIAELVEDLTPGSDGSLQHLQSMLTGYRVALGIHSTDEPFGFWPEGDFTCWTRSSRGLQLPHLGI